MLVDLGIYLGQMCSANTTCSNTALVTMGIIAGILLPEASIIWSWL